MNFLVGYMIGRAGVRSPQENGQLLAAVVCMIALMLAFFAVTLPSTIFLHLMFLFSTQGRGFFVPAWFNIVMIFVGLIVLWPLYVNAFVAPIKKAVACTAVLVALVGFMALTHDMRWGSLINDFAARYSDAVQIYLNAATGLIVIAGLSRILLWRATDAERDQIAARFTRRYQAIYGRMYRWFVAPLFNSRIISVLGILIGGFFAFASLAMGLQARNAYLLSVQNAAPLNGWNDARVAEIVRDQGPWVEWVVVFGGTGIALAFLINLIGATRRKRRAAAGH